MVVTQEMQEREEDRTADKLNALLRSEIKILREQIRIRDEMLAMCPYFEDFDMNEVEIQQTDNVEDNRSVEEKYSSLRTLYGQVIWGRTFLIEKLNNLTTDNFKLIDQLDEQKSLYLDAVSGRNK